MDEEQEWMREELGDQTEGEGKKKNKDGNLPRKRMKPPGEGMD
jgi:hypothetical protein